MRRSVSKRSIFKVGLAGVVLAAFVAPGTSIGQSRASRSVPVSVQNFPAVQAVEDVDNPALQPYQSSSSRFTAVSSPGVTLLATGIDFDPVPEGKRLVVQHLSYRVSGEDILDVTCAARVLDGFNVVVRHPLPLQPDSFRTQEYFRVSTPITIYVDPGQDASVSCDVRTTDDVSQEVGVTGYLVDL